MGLLSDDQKGVGCLVLFGGCFAAAGVAAMVAGGRAVGRHDPDAMKSLIGGLPFLLVGLGVMSLAYFGPRAARRADAVKAQFRNQPWKWKPEWAAGEIPDDTGSTVKTLSIFAFLWNAVAFPSAAVVLFDNTRKDTGVVWLVMIFPVIGLLLIASILFQLWRRHKFGQSTFVSTSLPFSPGGAVVGTILVPKPFDTFEPVRLRLCYIHHYVSSNGDSQTTHDNVVWEDEQTASPITTRGVPGVQIPVRLRLPADAGLTTMRDSSDRYLWRLTASAALPGADYRAKFELPVFSGPRAEECGDTDSSAHFGTAAADAPFVAPSAVSGDAPSEWPADPSVAIASAFLPRSSAASDEIEPPMDPGVTATRRIDGGWNFHFAARRNKASILVLAVFALIFTGATTFLIVTTIPRGGGGIFGAIFTIVPLGMSVVFGLFTLMFWAIIWQMLFKTTDVTIARGVITCRSTSLIFHSERQARAFDIENLSIKITSQSGERAYYSVLVNLKSGGRMKSFEVANGISGKRPAQWFADRITQSLGLSITPAEQSSR